MTYKDKPYSNNYEKRIYEAKEAILKAELKKIQKIGVTRYTLESEPVTDKGLIL